ncbi:hypothetical protein C8Q73DRAFT_23079 [Cubamyces lactineus]|nr:hypothetical protein C8Q73DRAFT_23079 [Cubamyces lactineus]
MEFLLAEIDRVSSETGNISFERISADQDRIPDEAHLAAEKDSRSEVFPILRAYRTPLSPGNGLVALLNIASSASAEPFLTDNAVCDKWNEVEDLQLGQLVCKLLDTLIARGEQGTFKEVRRFKLFQNPFHFDATQLSAKALNERTWTSSRARGLSSVYPEPDGKVTEYLTAVGNQELAKARHRWFLRRLIETAVEYLKEMAPGREYESFSELACTWRAYLSESGEATKVGGWR